MRDRVFDGAMAGTAISAPAWVPMLEQINVLLTTVSLVLGILGAMFAAWRGAVWFADWLKQRKARRVE
jgi:hypothetical protein